MERVESWSHNFYYQGRLTGVHAMTGNGKPSRVRRVDVGQFAAGWVQGVRRDVARDVLYIDIIGTKNEVWRAWSVPKSCSIMTTHSWTWPTSVERVSAKPLLVVAVGRVKVVENLERVGGNEWVEFQNGVGRIDCAQFRG
jgi:hypothetical protein